MEIFQRTVSQASARPLSAFLICVLLAEKLILEVKPKRKTEHAAKWGLTREKRQFHDYCTDLCIQKAGEIDLYINSLSEIDRCIDNQDKSDLYKENPSQSQQKNLGKFGLCKEDNSENLNGIYIFTENLGEIDVYVS